MKRLLQVLGGLVALAVVGVAVLWFLARSGTPEVPLEGEPLGEDAITLRSVLATVGDPRGMSPGASTEAILTQAQVTALAAEASRRIDKASARVTLTDGGADVTMSALSPRPWLSPYLNVHATLTGPPSDLTIASVRLGSLPLPAVIAQPAFDEAFGRAQERLPVLAAMVEAVDDVEYGGDRVVVHYRWTEGLRHEIRQAGRELLRDDLGVESIVAHYEALRDVLGPFREHADVSLARVMPPLFTATRARIADGGDPRREMESALLALTMFVLHRDPTEILGDDAQPPIPERVILLRERDDLPKHYLVSAMLTLFANRSLADAVGVWKEIMDATEEGGSGFSFADLTADRTATRLFERAVSDGAALDRLLARMAESMTEDDILPVVSDLPEGMDRATFEAAYRDIGSEPYRELVARIDAMSDETALARAVRGD